MEGLQEKVLAARLLALTAGKSSDSLDKFSGWLLGGFGGAFALIFGNIADVLGFVGKPYLRCAVGFFLVALLFGVFEKFFASIVASATATFAQSTTLGKELADQAPEIDFSKVFKELDRATLYPTRWLMRRSFDKAAAGDFAAPGRMLAVMSQVQGLLVLGEVLLCIVAASVVAVGLDV